MQVCWYTNKGSSREKNEDTLLIRNNLYSNISMEKPACLEFDAIEGLFCIADGVGVDRYGGIAGEMVLSHLSGNIKRITGIPAIIELIHESKKALDDFARKNDSYVSFGTTIAGIVLNHNNGYVFNCGDSRVYKSKNEFLEKISHDHSIPQQLFDIGEIDEDEMRKHPLKNIITSSISGDLKAIYPEIHVRAFKIPEHCRFLLCCDGIWTAMDSSDLEAFFLKNSLEEGIRKIIDFSFSERVQDNISIIGIEISRANKTIV